MDGDIKMIRIKKRCPKCNKDISLSNFDRHMKSCDNKKNIKAKDKESWLLPNGKYQCPYCYKEFSNSGIDSHIWRTHGEGKDHNPNAGYKNDNRQIWNKGLTKETSRTVKKMSEAISKGLTGRVVSDKTKQIISKALKGKTGGCREGSGKGKSGWYNNYWCDSSWELAFVIYNIEHSINFKRNTQKFEYQFKDEKHYYYPDFIMEDGSYIEIKGWDNGRTQAKIEFFPFKIKILFKNDIKKYLDYAIDKYGKCFTNLYKNQEVIEHRTKEQYYNDIKKTNDKKQENNINKVLNSNIDFSKTGWVKQTAELLNKHPQKINEWIKRYMPDFYELKCFKKHISGCR